MDARRIDSGNIGLDRVRAGGDQQAVVGERPALLEGHGARGVIELHGAVLHEPDVKLREVVGALAQVGPLFADAPDQHVRDRHARIRRFALASDEHDLVARRVVPQGLGGDDAGRSVAEDDVFHVAVKRGGAPAAPP